MGTEFSMVVWGPEGSGRAAALQRAFARVREIERLLTDYDPKSEARQVTLGTGQWRPISPILVEALAHGRALAEQTKGLVDPTVGPLTRLWRRSVRQQTLPEPARLEQTRRTVGFEHLEFMGNPDRLRCSVEDMRLDFGAFGKGMAIDQAFEILRAAGFMSVLVDGGGDLRVGAAPPGRAGWSVGLEAQEGDQTVVLIHDRALATSGIRFQQVEIEGRVYGHIIDPRTGLGIRTPRVATVAASTACRADGWATALCILGQEGLTLLPEGAGARILEGDGGVHTQNPWGIGIWGKEPPK
jgi:thiamine biosynthesis lipoprotein